MNKQINTHQLFGYLIFVAGVVIIALTAIVIFSFTSDTTSQGLNIAATFIMLVFASSLVGCLLGFVFGFPSYKENESNSPLERNTSFKQISDWLTKIIVGISLVQFNEIIEFFQHLVLKISESLEINPHGVTIIYCLITLFLSLGFMTGYLVTVTDIITLVANSEKRLNDLNDILKSHVSEGINSERLTEFEEQDILNEKDRKTVLNYVHDFGNDITDIELLKRLARLLFRIKEYTKSANLWNRIFRLSKLDGSTDDNELYLPKLNEAFIYSKHLKDHRRSNEILQSIKTQRPGWPAIYYNLACNYHRMLKDIQEEKVDNNKIINKFVEDINANLREAFKLDPNLYSLAIKDEELDGIDIESIFNSVNKV
ncbi:hypothetical protein [Roseivirga spongicola]|nr:hypothetical protein [Roseivirga spongicola]WPZ10837.1 hypothetical protein T7867_01835 [Roseivirga spongicola]